MSYVNDQTHQILNNDPFYIISLYQNTRHFFVRDLGFNFKETLFTEAHIKFFFCSMIAYDLKPYGPCLATDLRGILDSPTINCQQYTLLTRYFFDILNPDSIDFKSVFIGWNGGIFGNHAQLIVQETVKALLDPTYGFIVFGYSYDWIASGKPVPKTNIFDFRRYKADLSVELSSKRVYTGLTKGLCRPSDQLYFYTTVEEQCTQPYLNSPQARVVRPNNYP